MKTLTNEELIILVQSYKIQLDLGIYNEQMDLIFERIRATDMLENFLKICDLYKL